MNTDGDREKIYTYDAMRILQEVSHTCARLHKVVAGLQDEELSAVAGLRKQLAKSGKIQDQQRTKVQWESLHLQGQNWMPQDEIAKRCLSIFFP